MSETLADNSNISHYRIVSKIGADGMGEETRFSQKRMIKLLLPS